MRAYLCARVCACVCMHRSAGDETGRGHRRQNDLTRQFPVTTVYFERCPLGHAILAFAIRAHRFNSGLPRVGEGALWAGGLGALEMFSGSSSVQWSNGFEISND